jgi:hypothetical protein
MQKIEYLLLIHCDAQSDATTSEWDAFFTSAKRSGMFDGGSELGKRCIVRNSPSGQSQTTLAGFMRFSSSSRQQLDVLLATHPVVVHGGTLELYELHKA